MSICHGLNKLDLISTSRAKTGHGAGQPGPPPFAALSLLSAVAGARAWPTDFICNHWNLDGDLDEVIDAMSLGCALEVAKKQTKIEMYINKYIQVYAYIYIYASV